MTPRWLAPVALVLIVGMVLVSCRPDVSNVPSDTDPSPTGQGVASPQPPSSSGPVFADLERGWTRLPSPHEVRSTSAATVWTGDELVVWGGYVYTGFSDEVPRSDGFIFDARSRKWEEIAPSPLGPRILPASAWTGDEMLIWGGTDRNLVGFFDDGAAYDPETDRWRKLPPAPISPRAALSVWTGSEIILWGTAVRMQPRPRDGAAYDPLTNAWRKIASAPIDLTDASASWTGEEMIVFGAALHGGNKPETETAIGAAYDPTTDRWRRLPASDLSPQASTASWDGRELIAWDYGNVSAAYDPEANEWKLLPRVPLDSYECTPQSITVDRYVFGDYCGAMAVYDRADGKWHDISRHGLTSWGFTIVAADAVVLLLGRNVDTKEEAMFAYRPPTWY